MRIDIVLVHGLEMYLKTDFLSLKDSRTVMESFVLNQGLGKIGVANTGSII